MAQVIKDFEITIAIITVPKEVAKATKDKLIECGIKGILNFTSTPLMVPKDVILEEFDMITSLEKVVYFVEKT
jgi:redox-sensing transcriptional repressor